MVRFVLRQQQWKQKNVDLRNIKKLEIGGLSDGEVGREELKESYQLLRFRFYRGWDDKFRGF